MTHEQKPESAEFRTREVSAWQPISTAPKDGSYLDLWVLGLEEAFRFENAHYGVEQHECGEHGRYCDSCPAPSKRWIDAYGMEIVGTVTHWRAIPASPEAEAEQRRKDAEGAEPFIIVGALYKPKVSALYSRTANVAEAAAEEQQPFGYFPERLVGRDWSGATIKRKCSPQSEPKIPLYTTPANVAALEARVKELEGEVERLKKPQWFGVDEGAYNSPQEALEWLEIELLEVLGMMGFSSTGLVWAFRDGKRSHLFATEKDAINAAAAIREGGEHG